MFTLNSYLAASIQQFLDLRSLCGTYSDDLAQRLSYFDRFLVECDWTQSYITCQTIDDYLLSLQHLAPNTCQHRLSAVRQLCKYLAADDPQVYIPGSIKSPSSDTLFKPYIYSTVDIQALLKATSILTPSDSIRSQTYRVLLGLLYTTGIRIGEAIALNKQDFYRDEAMLFIGHGKFNKARWIPLSPSVCDVITSYLNQRGQCASNAFDSALFINLANHRLKPCNVNHDFHHLLAHTNITRDSKVHPRIHDLRHTFAVNRLLDWYRQAKDVNALLPLLATYMGHVSINSTQVYLHPTPELLEQANQRFYRYYLEHIKPEGDIS